MAVYTEVTDDSLADFLAFFRRHAAPLFGCLIPRAGAATAAASKVSEQDAAKCQQPEGLPEGELSESEQGKMQNLHVAFSSS